MKALKLSLLLALLSFFIFAMGLPAMAYTTGVKSGDWIKYDVDISISMSIYTYTYTWSFKGTIKMTITEVTSTTVSGNLDITGTTSGSIPGTTPISPGSMSFTIDTQSWTTYPYTFLPFLIPANLKVGDPIPGAYATVQAIEDWQGRKAVKTSASSMGITAVAYWDQATGALLEMKGQESAYEGNISINVKATGTNMFSLGFDWLFWIIIIAVVVVVVVIAVIILRRIRKPPTAPPPTEQPPPPPPPTPES